MRRTQTLRSKSKRSPVVAAFVVVAMGVFGYSMYQQANDQTAEPEFVSPAESTGPASPGTEMDGDGDGVPCEKQWCGR